MLGYVGGSRRPVTGAFCVRGAVAEPGLLRKVCSCCIHTGPSQPFCDDGLLRNRACFARFAASLQRRRTRVSGVNHVRPAYEFGFFKLVGEKLVVLSVFLTKRRKTGLASQGLVC